MKAAESKLKNYYSEQFSKYDKDIMKIKLDSQNLNENLLNNIKKIKDELITRLATSNANSNSINKEK